jgi:hypothetical protein
VRLQGTPGNPWGIGARIRLQFGPRLGPAREVHAGSGYWSQDSLVPVMGYGRFPEKAHVAWPGGKSCVYGLPPGSSEVQLDATGGIKVTRTE